MELRAQELLQQGRFPSLAALKEEVKALDELHVAYTSHHAQDADGTPYSNSSGTTTNPTSPGGNKNGSVSITGDSKRGSRQKFLGRPDLLSRLGLDNTLMLDDLGLECQNWITLVKQGLLKGRSATNQNGNQNGSRISINGIQNGMQNSHESNNDNSISNSSRIDSEQKRLMRKQQQYDNHNRNNNKKDKKTQAGKRWVGWRREPEQPQQLFNQANTSSALPFSSSSYPSFSSFSVRPLSSSYSFSSSSSSLSSFSSARTSSSLSFSSSLLSSSSSSVFSSSFSSASSACKSKQIHQSAKQLVEEEGWTITQMAPALGAEILGPDLSQQLTTEQFNAIKAALLEHQVIFFREQTKFDPKHHVAFAKRWGPIQKHPSYPHVEGFPEITVLENDRERKSLIELWHTDMTFSRTPPLGSILHGLIIPSQPAAGDTEFTSMAAAYDSLYPALQRRLEGMQAEHSYAYGFKESLALPGGRERLWKAVQANPPVLHPVVRTHPESGRQSLFVNRLFTTRIIGLPEYESQQLLQYLYLLITEERFRVRFKWKPHSIVMWDNRLTQHRPINDYWPQHRKLQRITVDGDVPFFKP
eukprot:gb/GEZN01002085.1/.p1 GENE.gb/GEZN01002085.1/~~gb/GEZN01002085.1/.p1  ORF type:complete len:586 (+),score=144.19 gb/GEZN01002085.1/:712-2469(+)